MKYLLIAILFLASCNETETSQKVKDTEKFRVPDFVYFKSVETGVCYSQDEGVGWQSANSRTCIPCDSLRKIKVLLVKSGEVIGFEDVLLTGERIKVKY